jgi:hypothetical protein
MPPFSVAMPADPVSIFFLVLLLWVPAAWVYLDAEQRGLSAYLWGGLMLLGSVITLIFYYRHRARVAAPEALRYRRGRIYEHVALLTFYGVVFVGLLILGVALIDYIRGEDPLSPSVLGRSTELRRNVALVVALLVIALPLLAVHYETLRRRLAGGMSAATDRLEIARLQRALVSVVVVLSALLALLATTMLVFEVVGRLFDVGGIGRDASTFGLSALVVGLLSVAAMYVYSRTTQYQRGRELMT